MSIDYSKEKNLIYHAFNEIQGDVRKHEQFAELLVNNYLKYPDTFIKEFSNCIYTVLAYKSTGKEINQLLQFISTTISRCTGDEEVPLLAPIIIEVWLYFTVKVYNL